MRHERRLVLILLGVILIAGVNADAAGVEETMSNVKSEISKGVAGLEKSITTQLGTKVKSAIQSVAIGVAWYAGGGIIPGIGAGAVSFYALEPDRVQAAIIWLCGLGFLWKHPIYRMVLLALSVLSYTTKYGGG